MFARAVCIAVAFLALPSVFLCAQQVPSGSEFAQLPDRNPADDAINTYDGHDDYLVGDVPEWLEEYGYSDSVINDGMPDLSDRSQDPSDQRSSVQQGQSARGTPSAPKRCNCLLCRDKLTGDWGGRRQQWMQNGIIYRGRTTQFFFGVDGGVVPPVPPQFEALGIEGGNRFEYTGNSRHDLLFDLDRIAGLPHTHFVLTLENVWGKWGNVSFETGSLSPAVFNALFPVDPEAQGIPRVTNFLFLQPLSEQFILSVGKTRTISVVDNNIFAGGDGSDQFLNQTFVANPLMVPLIPLSVFSVGAVIPQDWGNIGFSVMDPIERSTDFMDFGTLFSEGAILFGQVKADTNFFELPGQHHIGGFYRNSDLTDLRFVTLPPTYPYEPDGAPTFLTRSETSAIFYGFDQYLTTFGQPNAKGVARGWGLFGRASIADGGSGNPNFGAWHVSGGLGGDSPLESRQGKGDRFGFGYGYTATSSEFGAIPQFLFAPRDAQVLETYYRYHITPAMELTPDVQWIHGMLGGLSDGDDAWVFGLRFNMKL